MEINFSYDYEGKRYASKASNEQVMMNFVQSGCKYKLEINAKKMISNVRVSIESPANYDKESRIFVNGYQSWTDSREYFIDEKMRSLNKFSKPFLKALGLCRSGDYSFKKYSNKVGAFHGYSYSYIRKGNNFELFCSLNERTGYTIFNFDVDSKNVIIEKDLEGINILGEYEVLNFAVFCGSETQVFDNYFSCLDIPPVRVERTTGYTSWYNYYENITQKDIEKDLKAFVDNDKKFDMFQVDDGFQTAVGDWLSIDKNKFPKGMKYIADIIKNENVKAGIWLAPFSAKTNSIIAKTHPDWLVKNKKGKPIIAGLNWGGFYALDIYNLEVREYVKEVFNVVLNEWGFDMVKLDFLYGACMEPTTSKTRAEIMFDGMEFIRDCVGDKLVLGCGVPLAPSYGLVDYCRIGADVGLYWNSKLKDKLTHREDVSTINTLNNSIFRRQLDGRAFINDPDVVLLRDYNIDLSTEQRKVIALVNKLFGRLIFVSDRITEYNDYQMLAFDETMKKDDIAITSAEYIEKMIMCVKYLINGEEKQLKFDMNCGKIL